MRVIWAFTVQDGMVFKEITNYSGLFSFFFIKKTNCGY